MVSLDTGKQMMFGGTEEPCAFGELISIGSIGGEKNKKASACAAALLG
jgi:phenylpyruvate tautomerase